MTIHLLLSLLPVAGRRAGVAAAAGHLLLVVGHLSVLDVVCVKEGLS